MGKYPVAAVKTMAILAIRAESSLREYGYLQTILPNPANRVADAIAQSAVGMAHNLGAAAIFTLTDTGFTSRLVSKHRPDCPILAVTRAEPVARRLSLNWGVMPILYDGGGNDQAKLSYALSEARQKGLITNGDTVIVTSGYQQTAGGTDLLRIITIEN